MRRLPVAALASADRSGAGAQRLHKGCVAIEGVAYRSIVLREDGMPCEVLDLRFARRDRPPTAMAVRLLDLQQFAIADREGDVTATARVEFRRSSEPSA